jgi:hypothetical protein
MAVTHTLQAAFTQSIGKAIVLPAGSKTMVFFGTGGDGVESNRVAGGPALSVLTGTPVHAANYVSLGNQPFPTPTRDDCIDTNNPRDTTMFNAGWTWMACAKTVATSGNYAPVMFDQNLASAPQPANGNGMTLLGSTKRLILAYGGINNRASIQLNDTANWHFVGYTVPAGGGIGIIPAIWEFTENQAGQSATYTTTTALTAQPAMSPRLGAHTIDAAPGQNPVDIAWAFVASGVLTQTVMAQLAAAVRPWLARRGITA